MAAVGEVPLLYTVMALYSYGYIVMAAIDEVPRRCVHPVPVCSLKHAREKLCEHVSRARVRLLFFLIRQRLCDQRAGCLCKRVCLLRRFAYEIRCSCAHVRARTRTRTLVRACVLAGERWTMTLASKFSAAAVAKVCALRWWS